MLLKVLYANHNVLKQLRSFSMFISYFQKVSVPAAVCTYLCLTTAQQVGTLFLQLCTIMKFCITLGHLIFMSPKASKIRIIKIDAKVRQN